MDNIMTKYHDVEQSFQKIRTSTGNANIQEIVHKFLTREQTYGTLLQAVNENEKKLEDLKAANDQKQELLNDFKINYENMKKKAKDGIAQF